MTVNASDEAGLIQSICDRVKERLPGEAAAPCAEFTRQYYRWVPPEDLQERTPLDLYGAAVAHWNLAQHRAPGEAKVHVYNPVLEQHGWQSTHTVVEIISDDMPFLVDSVTMTLGHGGHEIHLVIHPVIRVRRDDKGNLTEVLPPDATDVEGSIAESVMHIEVERERNVTLLGYLRERVQKVLGEVRATVEDWPAMRNRAIELMNELEPARARVTDAEIEETREFLNWLVVNHFTFLGYRDYDLVDRDGKLGLEVVQSTGLGILRTPPERPFTPLATKARELLNGPEILVLTKANSRATVHRPAYLDYIGLKRYNADGEVIGERRFLGLYTTGAYRESVLQIPKVRDKCRYVLEEARFPPDSHDAKALTEILESYPRDSMFQIDREQLFEVATGILGLGERQLVRLFVRADPLDRFVACLVCLPRDRFNTATREKITEILVDAFVGTHADWSLMLGESLTARVHYIIHAGHMSPDTNLAEIEENVVEATREWTDDLVESLVEHLGEDHGSKLGRRYERAFPPAYRDDWPARSAVSDIERIEQLTGSQEPIISLYRPLEAPAGAIRCKLISAAPITLSEVLPTFEHMGARVVDERPYEVVPEDRKPVWIYDFGLRCATDDLEQVRERFQEAFLGVWRGDLEDDGLNGLVLAAEMNARQITVIRAIAKYLRQAGIPFSDAYMERTLIGHPGIVALLVQLFNARLDPGAVDPNAADQLASQIEHAIDAVQSLDEDRILRSFLSVVMAILRTNHYCFDSDGAPKRYMAFKLDPERIPILPFPRPKFEIFVYSPRVEGVHLRGGSVARGGLRWSDRREDFRTEILGLMKAQMVKNALIVPVGSKGGFVVKQPPVDGGREALQQEGIACYKTFLSGLLDLTDNIVGGEVVPPVRVRRYDGDDPYLVVAADKGTATFSDIANGVSADYNFWLGDAFASGGSQGYDHKAMGITARGAWESVKRHFRELATNIQETPFTVVGIGDMSGDVFGNGMLLSEQIKLVAAFNHMHVFLDPNPDPSTTFTERKRLFELGRSSWSDYNPALISEGGGIFERSAKSIELSPQVKQALGIEADELPPAELIRELLKAPVDLLWNGGIGTYVKASSESHVDAGDKANDAVRIDGRDLRCKVVGEGGNLGFTQRGRIEFADGGGRINTDAIDNVAGVNCSDHEVNIKILLGALVADGDLTEKQRNVLLHEMTDAVADRVLRGSYTQTQAMSLACEQAASMVDVHQRLIRRLEQVAGLHRAIEFLPSDEEIAERRHAHRGLLAPELAVVMAYCKIQLYSELLKSDLPEDPYLAYDDLKRYFPPPLPERYAPEMRKHRLRREIIATVVANQLVDRAGTTYSFRLLEETGADAGALARAYAVAREVYEMRNFWAAIEELDNKVEAKVQLSMLIDGRRLVERATRWLLRSNAGTIDIAYTIRYFEAGAQMMFKAMPGVLSGADREAFDKRFAELRKAGVPKELAHRDASLESMLGVFDIVEVAEGLARDPEVVMQTYFQVGANLKLGWLLDRIIELPRANRWQALARAALRDDLYHLLRVLTQEVLETAGPAVAAEEAIKIWSERHAGAVDRCLKMLAEIRSARVYDTTTLPVALREVRNLIHAAPAGGSVAGAASVTLAG